MTLAQQPSSAFDWNGTTHSYRPGPSWRQGLSSSIVFNEEVSDDLDPVTYEVIRHRLWTINMAHGETVTRVSGSPVFASLDFNMTILTEDAEVVLNAPFMQFLNAGAPYGISYIMEQFGDSPGINPGDIFVGNDPWVGAVHEMDVLVAAPVFVDGKLFAWCANAGHQYDLGGLEAGGWPQNAVDVYSDPVVLTPFKLVERGVMRKDLERMYLRHSRMPDLVALDLRAQLAGVRFARDSIVAMCEQFGAGVVKAALRRILASAQESFARKLESIPDGVWSETRYLDERLPDDRGTYRIQVNLAKTGNRLRIDNEGTEQQGEGPIGITFNGFAGSVFGVLSTTMLYEQLFAFGGAARQLDYEPTPGRLTCVDYPAACSAGILNVVTHMGAVQTCLNRMLACDPELKRDIVGAAPDYPVPVISGTDDRGQAYGQAILDHMGMGSGARSFGDGVDTGGASWSPLSFLLNVESVEQWYPLVYLYRRELVDSGGAGRYRGGVGLAYAWTPYRAESMRMVCFAGGMSNSTHCAEGMFGGYPSPAARVTVKQCTNLKELLSAGSMPTSIDYLAAEKTLLVRGKSNGITIDDFDVVEGTIVGGGGYGDPLGREPDLVATDVRLGYVSIEAALNVYGVVIEKSGLPDFGATALLRDEVRRTRMTWRTSQDRFGLHPDAASTPATGDPDRPVHEYLVASDRDGARILCCAECGLEICDYTADFKAGLLADSASTQTIPGSVDPTIFLDPTVELRRYCCPGCGTLMGTEVAVADDTPIADMRLVAP